MRLYHSKSTLVLIAMTINLICSLVAGADVKENTAPILDIDNQSTGYVGKISEHSVLVDLVPHLQIKNIEAINGICSYHVFKPNSEEFPFTIEIKDKSTGEAVIELIRKEVGEAKSKLSGSTVLDQIKPKSKKSVTSVLLDCNKRKQYDFLIQAHDCNMPSLYSNKVPVRIDVLDIDDYLLQFEETEYHHSIVESDQIHDKFMTVRATDNDCTNNGYACSYGLERGNSEELPFKINDQGELSTVKPLTHFQVYEFKVRAYDCLNNNSFAEADVRIEVVEPCIPQWADYPKEVLSTSKSTYLFEQINPLACEDQNKILLDDQSRCQVDSANAKLELILDESIQKQCEADQCENSHSHHESIESEKTVIFSGNPNNVNYDDDNIEDDYYDQNKINSEVASDKARAPLNYLSFSKLIENAQKINFAGEFGNSFTLNAWLRRPAEADKRIKEQVLCGSDSQAMNRHHFGLYFYRGSIKFLIRKENSPENKKDVFYPSLWEWTLPDSILNDNKWHFYEIRVNYPKSMLYIDGVHFEENKTNSDIIDAYELAESDHTGEITTYVGACYHARTSSLVDHFEGDIGNIVLIKHEHKPTKIECKPKCHESIEMNMVGNENLIDSIEVFNANELAIHTKNLNDMSEILQKINYINKDTYPQKGARTIKLSTTVHCGNNGKQISLSELDFKLDVQHERKEFNVQLEGDKTQKVFKTDLENGIEPFRDISIFSYEINKLDDVSKDDSDPSDDILLSQCNIKIYPERNVMMPDQNNEKVMFLQNLLDEFKFEFKETIDSVLISGVQKAKNYESFIRRLTYVITNVKDIDDDKFIKDKKFFLSCVRNEPNIETNTIVVELNVAMKEKLLTVPNHHDRIGFLAHKQAQKLVISGTENDILMNTMNIPHMYTINNSKKSPLMILLIAMCVCGLGFFLIFGAIRINRTFSERKRKALPNEENPNMDGMEWDDSGLNITENPLEKLQAKKEYRLNLDQNVQNEFEDDDEYTSNEDDEEEYDQYEDQYTSEEEPSTEKNGLEWDDTSLEIKMNRDKELQKQLSLNNSSNNVESNLNKFV